MRSILAGPNSSSGELILFVVLAGCLTLVGTIAAVATLPEALGVAIAFAALTAGVLALGAFVRALLRDPA